MDVLYFYCPYCKKDIAVVPVFHLRRDGTRDEATAVFSFDEKGQTGRRHCKIVYGVSEDAPSTAARKITGKSQTNGWIYWKFETKKGKMTLDQLLDFLFEERVIKGVRRLRG